MGQWSAKEYKEIEKLAEHAIDYTHYKVSCDFCYDDAGEQEYPEGDEAFKLGFRVVKVFGNENYVACKDCQEKEAWKKWQH